MSAVQLCPSLYLLNKRGATNLTLLETPATIRPWMLRSRSTARLGRVFKPWKPGSGSREAFVARTKQAMPRSEGLKTRRRSLERRKFDYGNQSHVSSGWGAAPLGFATRMMNASISYSAKACCVASGRPLVELEREPNIGATTETNTDIDVLVSYRLNRRLRLFLNT